MSILFTPMKIGKMEVKNRFIRSATWERLATEKGEVTDYIQYRKEKHQFNQKFIVITPKAVKRAKKIIKNKSKEFPIKFKNLILIWKNRFINYHKSL